MGHWTGIKYTFKLNEEDSSYEDILVNMQEEIDKKYQEEEKDPGESFSASMNIKNGKVIYSSSGYKSRVSNDLSNDLLRKIEKNINTKPESAYYFQEDNGENNGAIEKLFGYAKKVGQYLLDAGYADNYGFIGFYNEKGIEKFLNCIDNKEELEKVIKEGEEERLLRDLANPIYKVNLSDARELHFDYEVNKNQINEKWLAYFLVYGTNKKLYTQISPIDKQYLNLKEFLYARAHDLSPSNWPEYMLKYYTKHGVEFKEGLDSIDANFRAGIRIDYYGKEVTKELIENWYQKNKEEFKEAPRFSKRTAMYLKENYPETFLKLKNKLIELNNRPKGVQKMNNQQYWSGTVLEKLEPNEIFVFGSNPEGRHGAGAAKAAMGFKNGAKYGIGRGLVGCTYAIVTKNLTAGVTEKSTGIKYEKEGFLSVSPEQIKSNIDEMYDVARKNPDKKFLITYQYETYPNGTPKKSLNGYTSQEMLEMFVRQDIPSNIVFHDSYKPHLEKALTNIQESTQEVKQQMQIENKPKEYTFFFHLTSPFSNFHPSKFEYKEFTFVSNEQFMMFSKAKTFKDEVTAQKIIDMNNQPLIKDFIEGKITREQIIKDKVLADQWNKLMMKVKSFGREVANYDDQVWTNRRAKVVLFGAREKFTQNADLKQILLDTGDTYMVEASPYDKIWGIGLSAGDAKKTPENKWPGLNLLGKVLDTLKAEIKLTLENTVPRKKF